MDSQERADWLERLGARPIETGDWFLAALVWRFSPRPLRPPPPPSVCLSLSFSLHLSFPSSLSSPLLTSHSIAPVHFFPPPETQIKQESTKQSFDSKNTTREEESLIEDKGRPREKKKKNKASKRDTRQKWRNEARVLCFPFFSRPLYLFFLAPPTLSLSKLFGREKHVSRTWKMLNPTSTTPPSQVVKPCKHWCCDQVNTQGTHTCRKAHARQICRDLAGSVYSLIRSYKKKIPFFMDRIMCFFLLIYRKVKSKLPGFFRKCYNVTDL